MFILFSSLFSSSLTSLFISFFIVGSCSLYCFIVCSYIVSSIWSICGTLHSLYMVFICSSFVIQYTASALKNLSFISSSFLIFLSFAISCLRRATLFFVFIFPSFCSFLYAIKFTQNQMIFYKFLPTSLSFLLEMTP